VVAVILGGVLLGIVGALVAIPVAAALLLILRRFSTPASTAAESGQRKVRVYFPGWRVAFVDLPRLVQRQHLLESRRSP
jgi:hypothetical protein